MENNQLIFNQAKAELESVCDKYNVSLVPVVVHQGDRTFSSIEIVERQVQPEAEVTAAE